MYWGSNTHSFLRIQKNLFLLTKGYFVKLVGETYFELVHA